MVYYSIRRRQPALYGHSPTSAGLAANGCQHAADVAVGGDPLGACFVFQRFEAKRFRCTHLQEASGCDRWSNVFSFMSCDSGSLFYVGEVLYIHTFKYL